MKRRGFLLSSSAAALAACSPSHAALSPQPGAAAPGVAAAGIRKRLEIEEFSANPALVAALRAGVSAMRAVKNPRNVRSWTYWHYSHWMPESNPPADMAAVWDQCRHAQSYFLPWHRGFLYYFEKMLRQASGNPELTLPYWDYYKNPKLPAIFASPTLADGSENPLYWKERTGSTVRGLKYGAFADSITRFPWGPGTTFEDLLERNPHNRVHDQVGGSMGHVPTAVADPIFWAHHCNVDRYWSAWIAAGGQREMPPAGTLWWKEAFAYNLDRSWSLDVTAMGDTRDLGYVYDDLALPVAPAGATLPPRPPLAAAGGSHGAGPIELTARPATVELDVEPDFVRSGSFEVVLEGVRLTELGERGGWDCTLYANLPSTCVPLAMEAAFDLGEFGSFALSMPRMRGTAMGAGAATLRFAAGEALEGQVRAGVPSGKTLLLSLVTDAPAGIEPGAVLGRIEKIALAPKR
jgi:tyrosinase